jgi:hypothetical protein
MNLDANSLLASLLIGSVGLGLLIYGKKQMRVPQMATGLLLSVYPYFVSNVLLMLAIGVAAIGALWGALRLGW